MQIDSLTRENNHVHYRVLDDAGDEIRQVDRELTDRELRVLGREHKPVEEVVANTEGVEIVARQSRETASSSVVVHAFEPHDHPPVLIDHTHHEIKDTEDYLAKRIADAESFISRVQETLRGHGHEVGAHEHPDKPLAPHEHPHSHEGLETSLTSLQGLVTRLSSDFALATAERDNTAILARLMSVEGEVNTIEGIVKAHQHPHEHVEFTTIRGEVAAGLRAQNGELQSLNSRLSSHGHPLPEHDHPHEHKDLKDGLERIESRAIEAMNQGTEIVEKLATVDSRHVHQDDRDAVTNLAKALGDAERRLARHDHPHTHDDVVERFAKLDEKLGGHVHDYAEKTHEHPHKHEEIAHLDALLTLFGGELEAIRQRLDRIERAGYLTEIPPHAHGEYLTNVPAHDHPQYSEELETYKKAEKESREWHVISREETGGKTRLIVEEVR